MNDRLSIRQYAEALQRRDAPKVQLRASYPTMVEPGGEREITFTISTSCIDSYNSSIDQDGWDLEAFKRNPVVLWNHKMDEMPIGKCVAISVQDGKLKATVRFMSPDNPARGQFAQGVYQAIKDGELSATSVGFIIKEAEVDEDRSDGYDVVLNIKKMELREFSVVGVPSNPECIIEPGQRDFSTPASDEEKQEEVEQEVSRDAEDDADEVEPQDAIEAEESRSGLNSGNRNLDREARLREIEILDLLDL